MHRAAHNVGVAIDTAHGLVVPVLRDVQSPRTVRELGAEIAGLAAALARANKLSPRGRSGARRLRSATSGAYAGSVVAPVIVAPQVGDPGRRAGAELFARVRRGGRAWLSGGEEAIFSAGAPTTGSSTGRRRRGGRRRG